MDYEALIKRQAEVHADEKRCRICDRVRPLSFFPRNSSRYVKPYCKPCHKAYMHWNRVTDLESSHGLTVAEFRDTVLPMLIKNGQAPWATEDIKAPAVPVVPETLSEEEGMARQEAIYQELLRTMPSHSEEN